MSLSITNLILFRLLSFNKFIIDVDCELAPNRHMLFTFLLSKIEFNLFL